jgi:prephenate dehydrogenase
MKKVCIVGVGLIGGSLGLALRRVKKNGRRVYQVVGLGRSADGLKIARRRGVLDSFSVGLFPAVRSADIVVLCVPVGQIIPYAKKIRPLLKSGAILTDVGSVKKEIVSSLKSSSFVGGHPIAGSEKNGVKNAQADLFRGAVCVLTRDFSSRAALNTVSTLWKSVGAKVVVTSANEHDRVLALTSHLPHLLAFSLFSLGQESVQRHKSSRAMVGPSFNEMTRIAASHPDVWTGIINMNRRELLKQIDRFTGVLKSMARRPAPALHTTLARLSGAKRAW